ncbi:MAG: leucyl/phenylalanyl-tRNA--protein transferase [Proteobacteria bacterium]|nr:leucyl/phenylalanyl-tRNA--protein transferase [Pseudomonadota bacterium]
MPGRTAGALAVPGCHVIRIPVLRPGFLDPFPPVDSAFREPDGLLAAGGDLSPERLLDAYRHGIFPWYSQGQPILWWSPDPRTVFATDRVHVPTRLKRWLRHCDWTIHADHRFASVMRACAAPRPHQPTTWITAEMFDAYCRLHELGHAHSIEVHDGDALVGGLYGVAVGRMFFGESMFSAATNGSKVALIALCRALHQWGFPLLDAQAASPHLATLGAFEMPRNEFVAHVAKACAQPFPPINWRERWPQPAARELA